MKKIPMKIRNIVFIALFCLCNISLAQALNLLWRNNGGSITLWSVDAFGNKVNAKVHDPFPGWTAVNYADEKILWCHPSGQANLWTVNVLGNLLTQKVHGPLAGFTPVNYD